MVRPLPDPEERGQKNIDAAVIWTVVFFYIRWIEQRLVDVGFYWVFTEFYIGS